MVLDEKSAEKLYNRLRSEKSNEGTYKIAFENEKWHIKRHSITWRWMDNA